jgi:competence protein ComFB
MYHLKNSNEDLVAEMTKELMAETNMCHCDKCRLDVMAIALNHLQPAYVVTFKGELFANLESTELHNQADALNAVIQAIDLVKSSPKHD